jgi:glyoxylase-like metal-dependent hydrolase (beta-lactamase superfamily II)
MFSDPNSLPAPSTNQTYVTVSPIAGGFITLAEQFFVSPATQDAKRTVPSLTFLVTHPGTSAFGAESSKPFRMMFDLGLRRAKQRYSEHLQRHIDGRAPHRLSPGVAAQLKAGGLDPGDVDLVMLSHVHYDHHGDPEDFPNAKFVIGNGAMDVLKNGLGGIASHQHFEPDTLPDDRSSELSDPKGGDWKPLGPFPAALDLFQDGSVFVIDTPGHLPGHVNLLCRTKDRWLCLCGDSFHDKRLLTGEKDIGTWTGPEGRTLCIHLDKETAAKSIERLRELEKTGNGQVEMIAAHDEIWWDKNKAKQFPMLL